VKLKEKTWTAYEVRQQERDLERRVANAARELGLVKAWYRAELTALRKFRKAKVTQAARIIADQRSPQEKAGS
jgi:hypothetical protein